MMLVSGGGDAEGESRALASLLDGYACWPSESGLQLPRLGAQQKNGSPNSRVWKTAVKRDRPASTKGGG